MMTQNIIYFSDATMSNTGISVRRFEMLSQHWNRNKSAIQAKLEGIQFNNNHWKVIKYLRHYYITHGIPVRISTLSDDLAHKFHLQGGNIFLSKLFPGGPILQGCRIANLPIMAILQMSII